MKLYIVGPVASGKSTLARQLSRETGIPCFHLDQVPAGGSGSQGGQPETDG